ncbi:MAG: RagB/SusD family nutrient uptake outer membrane protein [Flammeovirgaceae bacterium]
MKYLKYILLPMLLVMSACEDFVDVEPTHQEVISNGLVDIEDYEGATVGVHSALRSTAYFGRNFGVVLDMMGEDIFETTESLGNRRSMTDWIYTTDDVEIDAFWDRAYVVILRANTVLSGIDGVEEDVAGRSNRLKAQALGLRALAHFDLLRAFAVDYSRNSTEMAIPIKLDLSINTPGRNTVAEVYDQIFADLNESLTLFDDVDQDVTIRSFFSKTAAYALLARVSLYAGEYADAINYATIVIGNTDTDLVSGSDFQDIWTAGTSAGEQAKEVIWEVAFTTGTDSRVGGDLYFVPNNRIAFRPSVEFIDLFDQVNDIRFSSYMRADSRRGNVIIPSKYEDNDGFNNFKVFRMGEMYLIRAEAYAESGNDANAMSDLNTLRAARITGYVDENLTGLALRDAISIERRKELFLEGHRWFDLRRAGEGIVRGNDCAGPATDCDLEANSIRFVWPIPQDEINANASIADQQNPGY